MPRFSIARGLIVVAVATAGGLSQPQSDQRPAVFQSPVRLAEDSGAVFVTDYDAQAVVVLTADGLVPLRRFAIKGLVTGIAASGGRVYVGNESQRHIEVWDQTGVYLWTLGGGRAIVGDPTDLAIDADRGLLFAVDGSTRDVKVFSLAGQGALIGTISGPGLDESRLQHPTGIALDPACKEIYVADFGSVDEGVEPRVAIFGYDGAFAGSISGNGGGHGYSFSKPQGIAVVRGEKADEPTRVLVTDAWLGRVSIIDRTSGEQVGTIGTFGSQKGTLRLPLDVLVHGPDQDVYVVSNLTRAVEAFAKGGRP